MKPPWQMSWPLSMSSRTVIVSVAVPTPTCAMLMPRPREARSAANMCAPTTAGSELDAPLIASSIAEDRRPLGHEGGNAFEIVVRSAEHALQIRFVAESSGEIEALRRIDRGTCGDQGARRHRGQAGSKGPDFGLEHGVIDAFPDQADALGILGRELVAEQRQRQRLGPADQTRQQPGAAAIGDEADLREGLDEARRARRDDDVATEREVRAGPRGDAVDRRDDRYRHRSDTQGQRLVVALDGGADVGRRATGFEVRRDDRVGEILPGAKAAAATGENEAAHVAVVRR